MYIDAIHDMVCFQRLVCSYSWVKLVLAWGSHSLPS